MASNQPVGFHHSLNHTLHNERILLYWNIQNDERNLHYSPRIHQCQHILASVAWNSFVRVQRTCWIKIYLLMYYCLEFPYHKGIHILDTESLYSMTAGISRRACSTTESRHGVLARLFIEARISNIALVNIDTKSSISSKTSWAWTTTKERRAI